MTVITTSSMVRRLGIGGAPPGHRFYRRGPAGNRKPAGTHVAQDPGRLPASYTPPTGHNRPVLDRDPVSELFDDGARAFLGRAYAGPGAWHPTRLQDPEPRHVRAFASAGIDVAGPDDASVPGRPGLHARSRWARGFVRAVYHQHKWHSGRGPGDWRAGRRAGDPGGQPHARTRGDPRRPDGLPPV